MFEATSENLIQYLLAFGKSNLTLWERCSSSLLFIIELIEILSWAVCFRFTAHLLSALATFTPEKFPTNEPF